MTKYEIPACSDVKKRVRNYKNFGNEGLFRSQKMNCILSKYKLHPQQ